MSDFPITNTLRPLDQDNRDPPTQNVTVPSLIRQLYNRMLDLNETVN